MTDCRIQSWIQKTSKARKGAPPLKELPPTDEAFQENVKGAVLQSMIWYSTVSSNPPDVDPTLFSWAKDMLNKILVVVTLPDNVLQAPKAILKDSCCQLLYFYTFDTFLYFYTFLYMSSFCSSLCQDFVIVCYVCVLYT